MRNHLLFLEYWLAAYCEGMWRLWLHCSFLAVSRRRLLRRLSHARCQVLVLQGRLIVTQLLLTLVSTGLSVRRSPQTLLATSVAHWHSAPRIFPFRTSWLHNKLSF